MKTNESGPHDALSQHNNERPETRSSVKTNESGPCDASSQHSNERPETRNSVKTNESGPCDASNQHTTQSLNSATISREDDESFNSTITDNTSIAVQQYAGVPVNVPVIVREVSMAVQQVFLHVNASEVRCFNIQLNHACMHAMDVWL